MNGLPNEMPSVWCVDSRVGHEDGESNRSQKASVRVRQPSQVCDDGIHRRPDWPFLYVYEGGRCLINSAPRRRTAGAKDYEEEARW